MPSSQFPYFCPVCDEGFTHFKAWRYHCYKSHNGDDPRQDNGAKDPELAAHEIAQGYVKPTDEFHCTWEDCNRKFKDWDSFWIHIEATHGRVGAVLPSLATQLDLEWESLLTNHLIYILVCEKNGLDPYD